LEEISIKRIMIKNQYKLVLINIVFFLLFITGTFGFAEQNRGFQITDYRAHVQILENGDARVSEIFTYKFSGNFNGIIRSIGLTGSDGLEYFNASQYYPQKRELETDREVASDMVTYRIYDQSANERKSFLLEYQLKNVVTKYNDIAEFYWKFFDQSNTSPIKRVQIEISFPGNMVNEGDLKVFGHGPSHGQVTIQADGRVLYEVDGLSSGEMVEARVLFPTIFVPDSQRVIKKDQFSQIMNEEINWAKRSDRENLLMIFGFLLIPIIIILNIITGIRLYFKYDRGLKPEMELDYYRELPADITPAVISYLMSIQGATTKDIMATLMDLVRRKYLQIEEISGGWIKKKDYRFILLNKDTSSLKSHEANLIHWFFYSIGNGESVSLKEIEDYSKASRTQSSFRHQYLQWQKAVKRGFQKHNYFNRSKDGFAVAFKTVLLELTSVLVLSVIAFFFRLSWIIFLPLLMTIIFTGVGLIIYGGLIRKKTQKGVNEYEKWSAFKRFLLHFSNMKDYEIPSLVIWEHYLVYAISLGIAEKVISKLRVVLTDQNINMRNSVLLYHMTDKNGQLNTSVFRSFNKTFSNAMVRTSSSSGSGGGFSSGGGRGGGGGGAGAF